MGGVAGGALAAAVSGAGGLGMIGVGSAGSADLMGRELSLLGVTGHPFGIGLLDWALRRDPGLLESALAASPRLISVSFGEEWPWVDLVRAHGVTTATQVCTVDEAVRAEGAGIDVVVARGAEGGGHGDPRIGTLPLLEGVLDAVTVPVLAAGGISTPRGLAAVLAAGASGAWVGTAFAACPESLAADPDRSALVDAAETDTVVTRAYDIALGHPWPDRYPERVLTSGLTDEWAGREHELAGDDEARKAIAEGLWSGDGAPRHVDAGQGVGTLTEVRPAADVVAWLCSGAAELLGAWPR